MDLQPAEKLACEIAEYAGGDAIRRADRAFGSIDDGILEKLERRLGRLHARQRLGIEDDHEARVFGQGINLFHPENWYLSPSIIRSALRMTGLYWRARRNAESIQIRRHSITSPRLPAAFDGFTILQLSDLHADMNEGAMRAADRAAARPVLRHLRVDRRLPRQDLRAVRGDDRGHGAGVLAS